jgi:hypothetical protein
MGMAGEKRVFPLFLLFCLFRTPDELSTPVNVTALPGVLFIRKKSDLIPSFAELRQAAILY